MGPHKRYDISKHVLHLRVTDSKSYILYKLTLNRETETRLGNRDILYYAAGHFHTFNDFLGMPILNYVKTELYQMNYIVQ